ncbi:MAG: PEP-CTERM sorting domain-containing protein [Rhodoferax sp.]|nr:PEP-CTERM sorting domain-containing protein [Rhodoferax sp.]
MSLRKFTNILASTFFLVGALGLQPVHAALLTFDGNICGGVCGNGSLIDANYGSTAEVAVSYANRASAGNTALQSSQLFFWGPDYNKLTNVAYGGSGQVAEIRLIPDASHSVTLGSFDLGGWLQTQRDTQYTVYDGLYQLLFSSGSITVGIGNVANSFAPGITSNNGIILQFGPDAFNVGIDNISFTANRLNPNNTVPEPGTILLLAAALLSFAATRKRKAH